jgi:uncharacterized protein (DUF1330 family)
MDPPVPSKQTRRAPRPSSAPPAARSPESLSVESRETTMPAYILTVVELKNVTEDFKRYSAQAAALSKQFGGEYLVRGKAAKVYEGELFAGRSVVLSRFPSMDQLKAFYESDEYQKNLKPLRAGTGIYDIGAWEAP